MEKKAGELTLYADGEEVPLEPFLNGFGEHRHPDITKIESVFHCPQCDAEQILTVKPPLKPNQSYPCHTCGHRIEFTPEWEPKTPEFGDESVARGRNILRRVLPFSSKVASPDDDDDDSSTPPKYHVEHMVHFMVEMGLRRDIRLLGQQNPSEILGIMMRLRSTERVRFGAAVAALVVLSLIGLWLLPIVSLDIVLASIVVFLGLSLLYAATEMPLIPRVILNRLRDEYAINELINGSVFIRYADYYRYGHQVAIGEQPDPIMETSLTGIPHEAQEIASDDPPESTPSKNV